MPTFLQPSPWLYKDDDGPLAPFMPGDPDGSKTIAGAALEAHRREQELRLPYTAIEEEYRLRGREEGRRIHRRKQLESLGESGWHFPDLRAAYDRLEGERQQPDIGQWNRKLSRDDGLLHGSPEGDGHGILYSGKVNLVFGSSESGKSMFSFAVIAQEIQKGNHAVVIDFEDGSDGLVARLHDLGVGVEQFVPGGDKPGGVYYVPARLGMQEDDFQLIRERVGAQQVTDSPVSLVVIDAVTEAMSADGLNPDKAVEVAQWMASMPKRFASLGPGVVVIDHTGHGDTERAQGSQHKKSGVDGVSLRVKRTQTFIPGRGGKASIYVAKDRVGSVREQAVAADPGEQEYRGTFVIDPEGDPFAMIGRHPADLERLPGEADADAGPSADDVMAGLIDEVVRVTQENPGAGKDAVRQRMGVGASNVDKFAAIDEAVRLGRIRAEKEPRGKVACYPVLPEKQLSTDDLTSPDHGKNGDLS